MKKKHPKKSQDSSRLSLNDIGAFALGGVEEEYGEEASKVKVRDMGKTGGTRMEL